MKHLLRILLTSSLLLATAQTVPAQGPGSTTPGFSGRLQGGAFFMQTNSQLSTADSESRTEDLDGPADTYESFRGIASLYLRYEFESGTAVYFGNPLEVGEGIELAAGVRQPTAAGTLDAAVIWLPIEAVWKNPYQTVSKRETSDVGAYGLRFKLEEIGGTPWEANYTLDRTDIEDDAIGDLDDNLKRDGWTHELAAKYTFEVKQGVRLRPELGYTYADIEGASNRYQGFTLGLLAQRARPTWVLIGRVAGFHNSYQERHPLFGKTRRESGISAFAQVIRPNLFGMQRLFASLAAGCIWSDANIDFFDSQTVIGLASVGIDF
jgi:hypothetical protein